MVFSTSKYNENVFIFFLNRLASVPKVARCTAVYWYKLDSKLYYVE